MSESTPNIFLTAEWKWLAMLNYVVDRALLDPLVPPGTDLDGYQGRVYVSVVGFLFQNTRVKTLAVPFHQNFEEVNLRFYVRRFSGEEWRRGVVFIKEIVPKLAIAATARWIYNENYVSFPMAHEVTMKPGPEPGAPPRKVAYSWTTPGKENRLILTPKGESQWNRPGSLEEFITEHYWGYARQKNGGCKEYRVEHPSWRVWQARDASLDCDAAALYGPGFADVLSRPPDCAFLAEGSSVKVYDGKTIV